MKSKRRIFRAPEEYEAWKRKNREVQAELERRIALIDAEFAARKRSD